MYLQVARIPEDGLSLEGSEPFDLTGLRGMEGFKAEILDYVLYAQYVSDKLFIKGTLSVRIEFVCSRCALKYTDEVRDTDFFIALDIQDKTASVDLTPEMREAILCAFPSHPVCKESCKGLCGKCGIDLNKDTCSCAKPADTRWQLLDGLDLTETGE